MNFPVFAAFSFLNLDGLEIFLNGAATVAAFFYSLYLGVPDLVKAAIKEEYTSETSMKGLISIVVAAVFYIFGVINILVVLVAIALALFCLYLFIWYVIYIFLWKFLIKGVIWRFIIKNTIALFFPNAKILEPKEQ